MGGRERNLCVNLDEKHEIHPSRVSAYHSPVLLSRLGTVPATCGPRRDTASFRWGNQCALQWVSACSLPREVFTLAPGCFPGYIYALTEPIKKKKSTDLVLNLLQLSLRSTLLFMKQLKSGERFPEHV